MEAALLPNNDLKNSDAHTTFQRNVDRSIALFLLRGACEGTDNQRSTIPRWTLSDELDRSTGAGQSQQLELSATGKFNAHLAQTSWNRI